MFPRPWGNGGPGAGRQEAESRPLGRGILVPILVATVVVQRLCYARPWSEDRGLLADLSVPLGGGSSCMAPSPPRGEGETDSTAAGTCLLGFPECVPHPSGICPHCRGAPGNSHQRGGMTVCCLMSVLATGTLPPRCPPQSLLTRRGPRD